MSFAFSRRLAELYLAAFVVWLVAWVMVFVHTGGSGQETVVGPWEGVQLGVMFVAAGCIFGVSVRSVMTLAEVDHPLQLASPDKAFAAVVLISVTCFALAVGVGVVAAVRALHD